MREESIPGVAEYVWGVQVPNRPCGTPGCTSDHSGFVRIGTNRDGRLIVGVVSALGESAIQLNADELIEFMDDIAIAAPVVLGLDISDAIGLKADVESLVDAELVMGEKE